MTARDAVNICNVENCTFSQTGHCVLDNIPEECPERLESLDEIVLDTETLGEPILDAPDEQVARFTSSFTVSATEADKLMRKHYCKVIGILGVPGTGKTASLASLYLLLSHGELNGFRFQDSKSLRAFEDIASGSRRWNSGKLPDQLTTHTELTDERTAGFLHLRLLNIENSEKIDLLMTDLPGEWTNSLINENRHDRLSFLQSAERIWITLRATDLATAKTRHSVMHRTQLLIQRLKSFLFESIPDICIVITHSDKVNFSTKEFLRILQSEEDNFNIDIFEIASFSDNDVKPGHGIKELINDAVTSRKRANSRWYIEHGEVGQRQILQYKSRW